MSDRMTPEKARGLISRVERYGYRDYTTIDILVDTNATNRLGRLVWDMAEMLARAHYEYAIARRTDAGEVEYETQFFEWSTDPDFAGWTFDRVALESSAEDSEYIARRLVIDLEEEDL